MIRNEIQNLHCSVFSHKCKYVHNHAIMLNTSDTVKKMSAFICCKPAFVCCATTLFVKFLDINWFPETSFYDQDVKHVTGDF